MTPRVVLMVAESIIADARHLVAAFGASHHDISAPMTVQFEDGQGNRYAGFSMLPRGDFVAGVTMAVQRPVWDQDTDGPSIDLEAAERARAATVIYDPSAPTQPAPGVVWVFVGQPDAAMAATGLTLITGGAG